MTGLGRGPEPPILRGHLQNFVFMITLLLLLLLLLHINGGANGGHKTIQTGMAVQNFSSKRMVVASNDDP